MKGEVTAYEEVTDRAGIFKVFKVEGTDGWLRRVVWYSSKLNIHVKSVSERLPGNYLGPGKFTSEVTKYPWKLKYPAK